MRPWSVAITALSILAILSILAFFNDQKVKATGSCGFVRGDADGSGTVTHPADFDYVMAYLFSSGPAPDPMDSGDANDDGDVTVGDGSYLANYSSGGAAPPPPFSASGFDPTPDPNEPECDSILTQYDASLTSYLPSSASSVQDIRPLVTQRGVGLDGSMRASGTHAMHFAGNPSERSPLGNEVISEATGTYQILDRDIALPATGFSWVVGRTYNARQETSGASARNSDGYQGKNWFQTSQPELIHYDGASDSQDIVYLIYGADRFLEFKRLDTPGTASNTFRGVNGAAGAIVFTDGGASVPDTYAYTDQASYEHTFFGFDGDAGSAAGQFWKTEDPAGNVAYVGHETTPATAITNGFTSGKIQYAYDTSDRRYTYTYTTLDSVSRLTRVIAETKTGGTWAGTPTGVTEVARVDYTYYSNETYGDVGDLETVTLTTPLTDSGQSLVQTKYYRYYEDSYDASTNPGYPHGLKMVVGFEGCRNYDYNGAADSLFDDDFLTASTSTLEPYAEAYFEYDTSHRIKSCWMSGTCGCSGGLNGTHNFTYATNGSDATGYDADEWRYRTVIDRPDSGYTTLYFDEVAQATARVVTDADPSASPTKTWSTVVDRDDAGRVEYVHTPANVTAYTHSTGSFTKSTSAGLVRHHIRETDPPLAGYLVQKKWSEGTSGSAYLDGDTDYTSSALTVGDTEVARAFMSSQREYTEEVTSGTSGSNVTTISTTLHSGTLMPSTVSVTLPDVSTGNNGEGATSTTVKRYFTAAGENTFEKSMDGLITYREYTDGQMTEVVQDADTASLSPPTGFASSGTELDWTTTYTYDAQGRRTESALPTLLDKETYYTQLKDRRLVRLSYNDVVSTTYYGPVQYAVSNHAGQPEVSATIGLPSNSSTVAQASHIDETDDDPISAVNGAWNVARMQVQLYDDSGSRLTEARNYFDTPGSGAGTDGTNYDPAFFGYDDSGRRSRVKEPHGTIRRSVYDLHNNVTEQWLGTNDSSFAGGESSGVDNMVKVNAYEFDSGSGGGNQYLTKQTAYVEDSTTDQRVTTYTNDARGRRLLEERPQSPHAFSKYDNLGRSTATGWYSSTASILASSEDPTTESTNRLNLTQTFYDERGRAWKTQRHKIDDVDGSDDDNVQDLRWYDREGRLAKRDGPQLEKLLYDRLGRQIVRYLLADDGSETAYADALTVVGDRVLVESQTIYDDYGDLVLEARVDRHHDDSGTGALDSNADADALALTAANITGRVQITAHWYDDLARRQDSVGYGTYGGSTFDRDGLSVPARSATALRTTYAYNNMGELERTTDPRDIDYYSGYDDAGRKTSQVSNADSSTPPGAPSGTDDNQTVTYAYVDGLMTTLTADMPGATPDQVTTYTYGTEKGTSAGQSNVATEHLLYTVQYPESSGGSDVVKMAYNGQEQLIWRQDQGGNIVETNYDTAGRLTARTVSTVGSGFDAAIRHIGTTYTDRGQVHEVTQYSNTAGSAVVDQVEYTWEDWGNVSSFEQDHDSEVTGSGNYYYDVNSTWSKAIGGRNTIRRSSLELPSGTTTTFDYASGIPANASRVSGLTVSSAAIVSYDYNGFNQVVGIDYPVPDIFRNYHDSGYPSLDRFNRVTDLQWMSDLTTDQEFVCLEYAYDENSNPTLVEDNIHVYSGVHAFDTLHTYDDLNRLTSSTQGNWTGSVINNDTEYREWTLDHAGNWSAHKVDLNGDTDYTDPDEIDQTRTHNAANEITKLGTGSVIPVYDSNGNMTDDYSTYEYEYDSFNRLRRVKNQSGETIAEYRYNGLGYLIAENSDTDGNGLLEGSDPWYHYVYDERWRKVATYHEDDAADNTSPKEEFFFHEHGAGESSHLNDDLVRRDRDGDTPWSDAAGTINETLYYCHNWRGDVVALVESGGDLVELAKYSAYGESFGIPGGDVDGDFDNDSSDATQIQSWIDASTYDILGDLDLDQSVLAGDKTIATGTKYVNKTLGRGKLSGRRNLKGYAGYTGAQELGHLRHVRNRVMATDVGRWLQRDPLGYVDGPALYAYVGGNAVARTDPNGLQAAAAWKNVLPPPTPYDPEFPPGRPSGPLPGQPGGGQPYPGPLDSPPPIDLNPFFRPGLGERPTFPPLDWPTPPSGGPAVDPFGPGQDCNPGCHWRPDIVPRKPEPFWPDRVAGPQIHPPLEPCPWWIALGACTTCATCVGVAIAALPTSGGASAVAGAAACASICATCALCTSNIHF